MTGIEQLIQNQYIQSLVVFLGFVVFARIFYLALRRYSRKVSERIKNEIYDAMLRVVTTPTYLLIISAGLYFSLRMLTLFAPYFAFIDQAFFVIFVLLSSVLVSRILSIIISSRLRVQKKFENIPRLINRIISIAVYMIAFLMILGYFKIEISPLVTSLGISGLIIGLALQNTLSNFFAGLYIISEKPIGVGDFIELPVGVSGYVEDIGWRSTRIRTISDTMVFIPNSTLAGNIITNDSQPENEMDILVKMAIPYDSDLRKVEKITTDIARKIQQTVKGAAKDFEPFMRYGGFSDSKVEFTVFLRVERYIDRFLVVHEFVKALKENYEKEEIKTA